MVRFLRSELRNTIFTGLLLKTSASLMQALRYYWSEEVHIRTLSAQQWQLSLDLLESYDAWLQAAHAAIDSANRSSSPANPAPQAPKDILNGSEPTPPKELPPPTWKPALHLIADTTTLETIIVQVKPVLCKSPLNVLTVRNRSHMATIASSTSRFGVERSLHKIAMRKHAHADRATNDTSRDELHD